MLLLLICSAIRPISLSLLLASFFATFKDSFIFTSLFFKLWQSFDNFCWCGSCFFSSHSSPAFRSATSTQHTQQIAIMNQRCQASLRTCTWHLWRNIDDAALSSVSKWFLAYRWVWKFFLNYVAAMIAIANEILEYGCNEWERIF